MASPAQQAEASVFGTDLCLFDAVVRLLARFESDRADLGDHFLGVWALGHDGAVPGVGISHHVVLVRRRRRRKADRQSAGDQKCRFHSVSLYLIRVGKRVEREHDEQKDAGHDYDRHWQPGLGAHTRCLHDNGD